jgi:hypothetical protein
MPTSPMMHEKKILIEQMLIDTRSKKEQYIIHMHRYKKVNNITEILMIIFTTLAAGSSTIRLVLNERYTSILSVFFSAMSGLFAILRRISDIGKQTDSYKNTYLQLSELERYIQNVLVQTPNPSQYNSIINEINLKTSFIESISIPIE